MSSTPYTQSQDELPTTANRLLSALRDIRNVGFVYSLERYLPEQGIIKQVEALAEQLKRFGYKEEAEVLNHVVSLQTLPKESGGFGFNEGNRLDSTQEAQVLSLVVEWLELLNAGKRPQVSQTLPVRNRESKLS